MFNVECVFSSCFVMKSHKLDRCGCEMITALPQNHLSGSTNILHEPLSVHRDRCSTVTRKYDKQTQQVSDRYLFENTVFEVEYK